jgi:hypothetical protein
VTTPAMLDVAGDRPQDFTLTGQESNQQDRT